ncbi:MAG: sulfotransferase [Chitinophagaceae bacterium]|nr:sulfotransferase [Chitinophagaceae bacterium]
MQALFLVGEQRSGSNLLRLMISNSHEIAAPHPPHILQRIDPIIPVHVILDDDKFNQMVEIVCRLVETNPVLWLNTTLNRQEVKRRCREKHVIAIYGAVMDIYGESNGAQAWLCKSMQNIRWADHLNQYFGNNKYIFLHRDGRDVALSFSKAVIGDKHVYCIAKQWSELQRLCLDARANLSTDRYFTVSYTELTEETESTLRNMCAFLGIEFMPEMMEFYDSQEAKNTAVASSLWENVTKPIMHHNFNKFLKEMSEADLRIFESVAGNELDELGYERAFVKKGEEMQFTAEQIAAFNAENDRRKKEQTAKTDPEDMENRRRQEQVLTDLKVLAKEWSKEKVMS